MQHYSTDRRLILVLLLLSAVSVGFFVATGIVYRSFGYWYLVWNLFLAWVPLGFVALLSVVLRRQRWSGWLGTLLTLLWLVFLPNSFYLVSDFIHLGDTGKSNRSGRTDSSDQPQHARHKYAG